MNQKDIAAMIERSSLGTRKARAARSRVSTERSRLIVARAQARTQIRAIERKLGGDTGSAPMK